MCRVHNANISALGGRTTGTEAALEIVHTFLVTAFESTHPITPDSIAQIAAIEAKYRQAKLERVSLLCAEIDYTAPQRYFFILCILQTL